MEDNAAALALYVRSGFHHPTRGSVGDHLASAGCDRITLYGDGDRSPVTDRSPELIAAAQVT